MADIERLVSPEHNGGKLTAIDFYAGWCASCKGAFVSLCRVPNDDALSSHINFYKANIESTEMTAYIKAQGIRGIPHVLGEPCGCPGQLCCRAMRTLAAAHAAQDSSCEARSAAEPLMCRAQQSSAATAARRSAWGPPSRRGERVKAGLVKATGSHGLLAGK